MNRLQEILINMKRNTTYTLINTLGSDTHVNILSSRKSIICVSACTGRSFVYRSFYSALLTFFLFLTLFKEKLCVLACVSKLLAWTVITCVEKMLSFGCVCSMVMGLLKHVSHSLQNILPFNQ